jgi:hypothetical protein
MDKHTKICPICANEGKTQSNHRVIFIRDKEGDPSVVFFCLSLQRQPFWLLGRESVREDIRNFARLLAKEDGAEATCICVGGVIVESVWGEVGETEIVDSGRFWNEIEPSGVFGDSPTAPIRKTPFKRLN